MNFGKQLKEGLITQNPVLVQVLGMCSTMAITTSFFNGLGTGFCVMRPSFNCLPKFIMQLLLS